eukprot:GHVH01003659.1.p1 GENE.GHVH01003659.1~~GHVH01003659.1.p1  ORF type:complete len:379 (+),score=37.21 GHVH01003659.1:120-1256(+)
MTSIQDDDNIPVRSPGLAGRVNYLREACHISELVVVLSGWFIVNLVITIYNKAVFQFVDMNYPMITTSVHLAFTLIGVVIFRKLGIVESAPSPGWDMKYVRLIMFSVLFTGNIWLSNWSVMVASLPLNQILRASVPLITVFINFAVYHEPLRKEFLPPIAVVVMGCMFTISGDLTTTTFGLMLVLISCAVSSLKGIISQKSQVNEGFGAPDILRYMCPPALIQLAIGSILSGEVNDLGQNPDKLYSLRVWTILAGAGVLAFATNMLSFRAVVVSDPLTMNVLANLKQVITSFIAIPLFGNEATLSLFVGVAVACGGSYWYASVRQGMSQKREVDDNVLPNVLGKSDIGKTERGGSRDGRLTEEDSTMVSSPPAVEVHA